MIKISESTWKEIKEFGEKEWPIADRKYYGNSVDYIQKDFVFKATEEGKIVGTIKGSFGAGVVDIGNLIVAHDRHRQGIGKALMLKAEEFGKKLGAHKFYLETGSDWETTKFYESLGYKRGPLLPNHHLHIDFVIYEKYI